MSIEKDMEKLGYSQKWLEYGILDKEMFLKQLEDFKDTGHSGFEHYRYGAFIHWLKSRKSATNKEITNYIDLALSDEDQAMGESAIVELLGVSWLESEHFELVKIHAAKLGDWAKKKIKRHELLRDLKDRSLDNDLFNACLKQQDSIVHEALIEHPDITKEMMKFLSEKGANKAVRNRAIQHLETTKR